MFHAVASAAPESELRWSAASHCVTAALMAQTTADWIPGLLDSLIAEDGSAYDAYVLGHRILTSHLINTHRYEDAVNNCTALFNHSLTYNDSLYVAIDLVGVQQAAGWVEYDGSGLDGTVHANVPAALRIHNDAQGLSLEGELLSKFGVASRPSDVSASIPERYALYQNYPNPFNPTTEIHFDLPEAARVELKVFNTLGQLVTTLVNDVRPAGSYRVSWDGKEVAAGMYIYQLKSGNFSDAKKMVLIK
jgi:hypothetical protein